jgi:dipeptidase E
MGNAESAHVFLAGGGGAEDSKLVNEQFVNMLDLSKPLVYIPNAMRSKPYESCLEWFRSIVSPLGIVMIEMWDDLHSRYPVAGLAGVYIGGGDTLKLLKEVDEAGFEQYLRELAGNGVPLYGGSAGAIILGEDIRTASEARHHAASEAVGLKIVEGYAIVCHYKPKDEEATRRLSKMLRQRIIAIPEKAGGYVAGRTLSSYGGELTFIIREDRVDVVTPGRSIEL